MKIFIAHDLLCERESGIFNTGSEYIHLKFIKYPQLVVLSLSCYKVVHFDEVAG